MFRRQNEVRDNRKWGLSLEDSETERKHKEGRRREKKKRSETKIEL